MRPMASWNRPVFPTPVGVFLALTDSFHRWGSLPHARGGVSHGRAGAGVHDWSSPRPWGCFFKQYPGKPHSCVFPTPVGVFLGALMRLRYPRSLPHARGGVSNTNAKARDMLESSPRPWGCFPRPRRCRRPRLVFPTPVGVFPRLRLRDVDKPGLPHARGGVSTRSFIQIIKPVSSPRPWGCFLIARCLGLQLFVFPTPVGVFPAESAAIDPAASLPHARGGVSPIDIVAFFYIPSSPRPWGCFFILMKMRALVLVFPTPVGVFPKGFHRANPLLRLPHARGGVSKELASSCLRCLSSPRPWGCFLSGWRKKTAGNVFPTPVGVFP